MEDRITPVEGTPERLPDAPCESESSAAVWSKFQRTVRRMIDSPPEPRPAEKRKGRPRSNGVDPQS